MGSETFFKWVVGIFALFPIIMGFVGFLSVFPMLTLDVAVANFFRIVFIGLWSVFAFVTGISLLNHGINGPKRMIIFSLAYVIAFLLLLATGASEQMILFKGAELHCWSPPTDCAECTCKFAAPLYHDNIEFIIFAFMCKIKRRDL